jgi:hypothetical protein
VNWSQLNVWAPGRKLAATIRGRTAAPPRAPRQKMEPPKNAVEPIFNRWHEHDPIGSSRRHGGSVQSQPSERLSAWRRRVLLKKGARLHASLGERASRASLAILDGFGLVVAWYDHGCSTSSNEVIGKHLTEFYIPTDVASAVPAQHLSEAAASGSHTRQGWRRRVDGRIYWGTTVIAPISMRNGRLQGYTHLTEESEAPWSGAALNSIRARLQEQPDETATASEL